MGNAEDQLAQIANTANTDWSIPSLGRLTTGLSLLDDMMSTLMRSEAWKGTSADASKEAFSKLRNNFRDVREQTVAITSAISRANAVRADAISLVAELPSSQVDPVIVAAARAGSAVVFRGVTLPADTAISWINGFLGSKREEAAQEALNTLSGDLETERVEVEKAVTELRKYDPVMPGVEPPDIPEPTPTPVGPGSSPGGGSPGGGYPAGGSPGGGYPTGGSGAGSDLGVYEPTPPSSVVRDPSWETPHANPTPPTSTPPTHPVFPPPPSVDGGTGGSFPGGNGSPSYPGAGGIGGGSGLGGGGLAGGLIGGSAGAAALAAGARAASSGIGGLGAFGGAGAAGGAGGVGGAGGPGAAGRLGGGGLLGSQGAGGGSAGVAGGSGAAAGGRGGVGMMGGGGGAAGGDKDKRSGLGGLMAPKLEDEADAAPRSAGAGAGGREQASEDPAGD